MTEKYFDLIVPATKTHYAYISRRRLKLLKKIEGQRPPITERIFGKLEKDTLVFPRNKVITK